MVCWWDWGAPHPWMKTLALPLLWVGIPPPWHWWDLGVRFTYTCTSAPPHAGECGC